MPQYIIAECAQLNLSEQTLYKRSNQTLYERSNQPFMKDPIKFHNQPLYKRSTHQPFIESFTKDPINPFMKDQLINPL